MPWGISTENWELQLGSVPGIHVGPSGRSGPSWPQGGTRKCGKEKLTLQVNAAHGSQGDEPSPSLAPRASSKLSIRL